MNKKQIAKISALALALPSSILGVSWIVFTLVSHDVISKAVGIVIVVAVVIQSFYLMVRYALDKKNPS